MKKHLITIILLCCLLFFQKLCLGQSSTDSLQNQQAINTTVNNFNKSIGQQSWLYNGTSYSLYDPNIKGSAYFRDSTSTDKGSLIYYGVTYTNIPLFYDLNKDLLVSFRFDGFSRFAFLNEKVSEFNLNDHHFINLDPDSLARRVVKPGFYDELYVNKLQVLARREKDIEQQKLDMTFIYRVHYYLKKGDHYYSIDGEGDLINVLKDHKKELKQYIKDNKIKFGKDPEKALVMLATYYDHLTN